MLSKLHKDDTEIITDDPTDISCEFQVGKLQVGLVEVHVDALELQVRVAVVRARRIDAVLVRDHLQERIRLFTCVMFCVTQD